MTKTHNYCCSRDVTEAFIYENSIAFFGCDFRVIIRRLSDAHITANRALKLIISKHFFFVARNRPSTRCLEKVSPPQTVQTAFAARFKLGISARHFFFAFFGPPSPKRPRCLDPDTNFGLARQRSHCSRFTKRRMIRNN